MIPNPAQLDYFLTVCKKALLIGTNQIGKTDGLIINYLLAMGGIHPAQKMGWMPKPPIFTRITAANADEGIKQLIEPKLVGGIIKGVPVPDKVKKGWCPPAWIEDYDKTDHFLTLHNGSTMQILSRKADIEAFGGPPKHMCGDDEPPDEAIWNENWARLTKYNGCSTIAMTPQPKKGKTWVYFKILKGREDPKVRVKEGLDGTMIFRGIIEDNKENLSARGIARFRDGLTTKGDKVCRGQGLFFALSGTIFESFSEIHKARALDHRQLEKWRMFPWFRGIDLGIGDGSPTTCLWAVVVRTKEGINEVHIVDEYGAEDVAIPRNAQIIKAHYPKQQITISYIDPVTSAARNPKNKETQLKVWVREGIRPCKPGVRDVALGVSAIEDLLRVHPKTGRPRLIIHDNCPGTLEEMSIMTYADLKNSKKGHYLGPLRWLAAGRINEYTYCRIPGAIYGGEEEARLGITDNSVDAQLQRKLKELGFN